MCTLADSEIPPEDVKTVHWAGLIILGRKAQPEDIFIFGFLQRHIIDFFGEDQSKFQ